MAEQQGSEDLLSKSELVRAAVLRNIDLALNDFGLDANAELERLGYSNNLFRSEDARLPFREIANLLESCSDFTECKTFGLALAKRQNVDLLGIVGLLLQTSQTIRAALTELQRILHIHASPIDLFLYDVDDVSFLHYSYRGDRINSRQTELSVQLGLGQCYQILQYLTSQQLQLQLVQIRHSKPEDAAAYESFFSAPIEFGAESDALVFDRRLLEIAPPFSNIQIHDIIQEKILFVSYLLVIVSCFS